MKTFTASNGSDVRLVTNDTLTVNVPGSMITSYVNGHRAIQALRDYFRAERDEELGLWRHEDYPEYSVKYSTRKKVAIVHYEPGNGSTKWTMDEAARIERGSMRIPGYVARLFFEQWKDPDRPWESAKAGDLWILTLDDDARRSAAVRQNIHTGVLQFVGEGISTLNLKDHHIVDGTLLYRIPDKKVF